MIDELKRLQPAFVFTTSTRPVNGVEATPPGMVESWRMLEEAGIPIVAVRDTPWMRFDVAECVEVQGKDSERCQRPREKMLLPEDPARAAAAGVGNVNLLDLSRFFCTERTCLAVAGNVMIYNDKHHISATYMRTLAPFLEQEMRPFLVDRARFAQRQP